MAYKSRNRHIDPEIKLDLKIDNFVKKINSNTVAKPDEIDKECLRELEDELISAVRERYDNPKVDGLSQSDQPEKILGRINKASAYLEKGLIAIAQDIESDEARILSTIVSRPTLNQA